MTNKRTYIGLMS